MGATNHNTMKNFVNNVCRRTDVNRNDEDDTMFNIFLINQQGVDDPFIVVAAPIQLYKKGGQVEASVREWLL